MKSEKEEEGLEKRRRGQDGGGWQAGTDPFLAEEGDQVLLDESLQDAQTRQGDALHDDGTTHVHPHQEQSHH